MRSFLTRFSALTLIASGSAVAQESVNQIIAKAPEAEVTTEAKRYSGRMSFSLTGRRFDDEIVNSRFTRAMLTVEIDATFNRWLGGRFAALQNFTSGATSNLYSVTEGASGSNGALIDEAYMSLTPTTGEALSSRLEAGIISLGANPILSAMYSQSWMAVQAEAKNTGSDGFLSLTAAQGTPSAGGTSNRVIDADTLPIYTTAAVNGKIEVAKSGWSVGAAAAHYVFTDLASQAAVDSAKLGATTMGNGKAGYLFVYEFRGMEYAALLEKKFSDGDTVSLKASAMKNELAPSGNNTAQLAKLEHIKNLEGWRLKSSVTGFRIQSDALPATYAISSYGFTNRVGANMAMKLENLKEKYAFYMSFTNAAVLEKDVAIAPSSQFQADRQIYNIGAEVTHDIF